MIARVSGLEWKRRTVMKSCRGMLRALLVGGLWPLCVAVFPGLLPCGGSALDDQEQGGANWRNGSPAAAVRVRRERKNPRYSADMLSEIMKGLPGVRVERLDLPWQGILPGLTAKRFDYVVTSVTVSRR